MKNANFSEFWGIGKYAKVFPEMGFTFPGSSIFCKVCNKYLMLSEKVCNSNIVQRSYRAMKLDDIHYDLQTGFLIRYDANAFQ